MFWSECAQMIYWGRPKKPWMDFRCKSKKCCKKIRSITMYSFVHL